MYGFVSKNFVTRGLDRIEDVLTEHKIKNTAKKYGDPLAQIIRDDLKPLESEMAESYIQGFRRYRQDDRKREKDIAKVLERPDIIEIVKNYDDNTAKAIMKSLGSITIIDYINQHQDGTLEKDCEIYQTLNNLAERIAESGVPEIIDKIEHDCSKFDWFVAGKFASVLLNTNDETMFKYITDTIDLYVDHYDGSLASNVLDGLTFPQLSDEFDIESAKNFYNIMTAEKIRDACKKPYNGDQIDEHNSTKYNNTKSQNIALALSAIAKYTQDKDLTELAVDVFDKFDETNVGVIAAQIYDVCWIGDKLNYLPHVLKSINNIQETDSSTAEILAKKAGSIIDLLGDKTPIVLAYMEKNRDPFLINEIVDLNYPETVSDLIRGVDSASIEEEKTPELIELITRLDNNIQNNLISPLPTGLNEAYAAVNEAMAIHEKHESE